jgi:hypothetical protein
LRPAKDNKADEAFQQAMMKSRTDQECVSTSPGTALGTRIQSSSMSSKASKSDVDYSHGHRDSHCGKSFAGDTGYCRHFIETPSGAADLGACERVSGSINRVYWCRLFARAQNK